MNPRFLRVTACKHLPQGVACRVLKNQATVCLGGVPVWIRFTYDATTPQMNFRPGPDVEVPDRVVRRWELIWELFILCGIEMNEWKPRGFSADTRALPASFHALELIESEKPTAALEMNELVRRMAERERREATERVS